MAKEKKLQKKFGVELGGVSLGKKDTAKITCAFKFNDAGMDANEVKALLAAGQLHCRLDRAPGQGKLDLGDKHAPPTAVEFDATCHRISMDDKCCYFCLSFPKAAASADTLAEFAGQSAKLIVTRRADIQTADDTLEDDEEEAENDDEGGEK